MCPEVAITEDDEMMMMMMKEAERSEAKREENNNHDRKNYLYLAMSTRHRTSSYILLLFGLAFMIAFTFFVHDATIPSYTLPSTMRKHSETQTDYDVSSDRVSISLIVIASHQRSSSTFLSYNILTGKRVNNQSSLLADCGLALNEILTNSQQQSGDAWEMEGKRIFGTFNGTRAATHISPSKLASFIVQVGQRRCKEVLHHCNSTLLCDNHCFVNYKHFPSHLDTEQAKILWDALLNETVAQSSGNWNPFGMIVLERNVQDRWKSRWYARKTGDWCTHGDADHKAKLNAAKVPIMEDKFRIDHENWYKSVRAYIQTKNAKTTGVPFIELSFDNVTNNAVEVTRDLVTERLYF